VTSLTTTTADRFLRVARGEASDCTPVWFMRQAGRSLPEYRDLRAGRTVLELCRDPELAVEATLQPVRRLGVDAAILFSDIVVPLQAMGMDVEIRPGVGPVIEQPIRTEQDVARLHALEPESGVPFVFETIMLLRKELTVPLIGFAGAPFTLASYLVEGGPSKDHARTRAMMYSAPDAWTRLMDRLTGAVLSYLRGQVIAGAQAVQIFDSWVGHVNPIDYERLVRPWVARIVSGLADLGVPRILFGLNSGELLGSMAGTGVDVLGVDWRTPLDRARLRLAGPIVLQGNLDPAVCLAPWEVVCARAVEVLERGGGAAHIFNLGHGVLPDTDPDTLARLVELVHRWEPSG
jgi:uroporphyrinogen decarboxylase